MRTLLVSSILWFSLVACSNASPPPPVAGSGRAAGSGGRTGGRTGGSLSGSATGSSSGTSGGPGTSSGSGTGTSSGTGGTTGGGTSGSSSTGGNGGGCAVQWQGATRTFGPAIALSSDPASSVAAPVFLPSGLVRAVVIEPSLPQLALADPTGAAGPQRLDAPLSPGTGSPPLIQQPLDDSSALVVLEQGGQATAVSYVSADGSAHGPFTLANAGLTVLDASLPLEGGAGAVLLGQAANAGLAWVTVTSSGISALRSVPLGISGVQSVVPALWDDGQGGVWALLQVAYGSSSALLAMHGGGTPFAFAAPARLDTVDPGAVAGFQAVLGPQGALGVLLVEGASTLAGYALTTSGTPTGGILSTLAPAPTLPSSPASSPGWLTACSTQGSCDPAVRFDGAGDLLAAWTLSGELNVARLPAGSSTWSPRQQLPGGPLASTLAVDASGDASALTAATALLLAPSSGGLALTSLPGLAGAAVAASTGQGGGSVWGTSTSQPDAIVGWTFGSQGLPQELTPVVLPGGVQAQRLILAAPPASGSGPTSFELAYPSSFGPSFSGTAGPGWAAIAGAGMLFLATYDPASGALGTPAEVALPGWQAGSGPLPALQVDTTGAALLAFSQAVGTPAPNLYVATAAPGSTPAPACAPLPPVQTSTPLTFATSAVAGGAAIFCGRDAPATAAVAE